MSLKEAGSQFGLTTLVDISLRMDYSIIVLMYINIKNFIERGELQNGQCIGKGGIV